MFIKIYKWPLISNSCVALEIANYDYRYDECEYAVDNVNTLMLILELWLACILYIYTCTKVEPITRIITCTHVVRGHNSRIHYYATTITVKYTIICCHALNVTHNLRLYANANTLKWNL